MPIKVQKIAEAAQTSAMSKMGEMWNVDASLLLLNGDFASTYFI